MPRQKTIKQVARDLIGHKGRSPVPTDFRRARVGASPVARPEAGVVDDIGKMVVTLTDASVIAMPDKNTDLKGLAHSILFSIGAGVINEIEPDTVTRSPTKKRVPVKTDFSLLKTETDRTIIPNPDILDIKSIDKQLTQTPMVPATTMFPTLAADTFFEPEPQPEFTEIFKHQQELKKAQISNTIDLAFSLVRFQADLPSDRKLKAFKFSKDKGANPKDNQNSEFEEYDNPDIIFDDLKLGNI